MKNILKLFLGLVVLMPMSGGAEEQTPDPMAVLKTNIETIRKIVLKSKNDKEMRENVKGQMDGFVNFKEFGKLSMASRWEKLTDKQKELYLQEFRGLLQRTYLRRFKPGKDFNIKYRSDIQYNKTRTRAQIKTTIVSGDVEADVDYRFHLVDGGWKVYDLIIDYVSVMRNYRKSFLKVYDSDGFDALLEKMKKKTSEDVNE